jgi:agmatinase
MMVNELDLLEQKAFYIGSSRNLDQSDKIIIGLPMDATTSFRPGARLAPYRLREVSEGIEEYSVYLDKSLEDIEFYDAGDVILPWGNVIESLRRIQRITAFFLDKGKKIYSVGGEHLVTLPLIRAYKSFYSDLVVIQMDAHADLRKDYLGEPLSHAAVMRKVLEEIGEKNLFQLGIRSGTSEEISFGKKYTNLYIDQFLSVLDEVKNKIGSKHVYISLDIDILDPAFAPGTGTPEPGGISSREVFKSILELSELNIVGFDLVEISPPYDKGDITSILGAKILREALLAF